MRHVKNAIVYLILIAGGITMIVPFLWMITTSLKTQGEVNRGNVGFDLTTTRTLFIHQGEEYPVKVVRDEGEFVRILFYNDEQRINMPDQHALLKQIGMFQPGNPAFNDYPRVRKSTIQTDSRIETDWGNFSKAWNKVPFGRYFLNTILVSILVTIGVLISGSLAAYAFARMQFMGRDFLFYLFISMMMVPQPIYLIPSYILLNHLGWIDTYAALVVPWIANIFTIFLLRQHFKTLPRDLFDAAAIDGCSRFRMLWQIVLPLSRSVLVTAGIFSLIGSWNSFMWPLIVTNSDRIRVLQVGLSYFSQEASTQTSLLMAASTFSILPLIILFLFAQRQIISSFASSGMKG